MCSGEEGALAQEEARTLTPVAAAMRHHRGRRREWSQRLQRRALRLSIEIDATVCLAPPRATGHATVKMFQQAGQADHGARAMPARLDSAALHSQ